MSIRYGDKVVAGGASIRIDNQLSTTSANPVQNKTITTAINTIDTTLSTKQDVISDLATIRSGATAGATAVQPGDLATVATTGQYSDLSGKPTTLAGYGITDAVQTGHEVIAFQAPTSANNYTWYRKYADGWVEQGGLKTISGRTGQGSSYVDVTLPVVMADANYTPMVSITTGGNYWASAQVSAREPSTTTIRLIAYWNASGTFDALPVAWTVCGKAA